MAWPSGSNPARQSPTASAVKKTHPPARHRVAPFAISGDPAKALARLKTLLEDMPRTRIAAATDDYLHAVCRTRLGFPDDVECLLSIEEEVIHIRSASRLGYSDWGVNRRRVEALRRRFERA